jgi:hypothetical protein
MKTTIFRSSWLVMVFAGAMMAPARLSAQGDSTRTHVVRSGDTLWKLAQEYLGDGRRWREILELNAGTVRTADALAIGTTLRIPGAAAAPAPPPAGEPPIKEPPAPPAPVQARDSVSRTIFFGVKPAGGFVTIDSSGSLPATPPVPATVYEAISAPFVLGAAALDAAGHCVSIATGSGSGGVLLQGALTLRLPPGATGTAGSRWSLVRRGVALDGLGHVAIPTGVVRVTGDAATPGAVTAEVIAQFDAISCDDRVLEALAPTAAAGRAQPVTDGAMGRVVWVVSESLLPTLQHALIVDIGRGAGIRSGDVLTIFAGDGNEVVARATVVRADERTATALVMRQSLGSLAAGLRVRVTEKLP